MHFFFYWLISTLINIKRSTTHTHARAGTHAHTHTPTHNGARARCHAQLEGRSGKTEPRGQKRDNAAVGSEIRI